MAGYGDTDAQTVAPSERRTCTRVSRNSTISHVLPQSAVWRETVDESSSRSMYTTSG